MSALRGLRVSKFRHVYGQSTRREQCYESVRITTSAHDSQFCAVNPKFIAVVIEVAGGGAFQVLPLKWTGKVDYHFGRVSGHNGPVTDLKWNPFNDNIIASASDDCTIKLWHVPDDGLRSHVTVWLCELNAHTRRVAYIEWHPTAENVLSSIGFDLKVLLWNVSTGDCLYEIDCHPDTIYSMSFNRCGSLIATTCKDKMLRVIDVRSGKVLQQGMCHDGAKASKVAFLGDKQMLVTTGFSRASRRQMAIWDQHNLKRPLASLEVDSSSGVLFPFYDMDLNLLYIAGKGDGNIRYYEICDTHPWIHYLSEFQSRFPQRGLGFMPKRGLNVSQCEIFRFYKVHTMQPLVEPISLIVPRKSDAFQSDLYPPTTGPTPALTTDEWVCGLDKNPVQVSLKSGFVPVTSKPVQVKQSIGADEQGHKKALLITADRNNERKFRFLSEVTTPDYRHIEHREDYEDIVKQQQFREKLTERLALRMGDKSAYMSVPGGAAYTAPAPKPSTFAGQSFSKPSQALSEDYLVPKGDGSHDQIQEENFLYKSSPAPSGGGGGGGGSIPPPPPSGGGRKDQSCYMPLPKNSTDSDDSTVSSPRHSMMTFSNDDIRRRTPGSPSSPQKSPSIMSAPVIRIPSSTGTPSSHGGHSPQKMRRISDSPQMVQNNNHVIEEELEVERDEGDRKVSSSTSTSSAELEHPEASPLPVRDSLDRSQMPKLPKPLPIKPAESQSPKPPSTSTRPGCIVPGPMVAREQTAHIKPFRIYQRPAGSRAEGSGSSSSSQMSLAATAAPAEPPTGDKEGSDFQRLYVAQCRRVRELLEACDAKDRRISQLESDVASLAGRLEKSLADTNRSREDMNSLRYEIQWKDQRIEYLEKQLAQRRPDDKRSHSPES